LQEVVVAKFGTVAKFSAKPGKEQDLLKVFAEIEFNPSPGFLYSSVFRSVDKPDEFWVSVVYESEEAYRKNASSPDSGQRYQRMIENLQGAPEWHDGHVIADAMRKPENS
jgi:heme-degrading monooxygenase HmoA